MCSIGILGVNYSVRYVTMGKVQRVSLTRGCPRVKIIAVCIVLVRYKTIGPYYLAHAKIGEHDLSQQRQI